MREFEIVLYFQHRPAAGSGWSDGWDCDADSRRDDLVTGCEQEWVVGTLVGMSIFSSGVTRLMISLAARRVVTKAA